MPSLSYCLPQLDDSTKKFKSVRISMVHPLAVLSWLMNEFRHLNEEALQQHIITLIPFCYIKFDELLKLGWTHLLELHNQKLRIMPEAIRSAICILYNAFKEKVFRIKQSPHWMENLIFQLKFTKQIFFFNRIQTYQTGFGPSKFIAVLLNILITCD